MTQGCAVLDIGKTHARAYVVTPDGQVLGEERTRVSVLADARFPSLDTEGVWDWILRTLPTLRRDHAFDRILPVAHGAAAALVERDALLLPILDYEAPVPDDISAAYDRLRPPFAETGSPGLPAGLNLGRQLFRIEQEHPDIFSRAALLTYPQYWAWRLSGALATDLSSLGCHTDLWSPIDGRFSSMAHERGWNAKFPPIRRPGTTTGLLRPELAKLLGGEIAVLCGVHDSNAALAALSGVAPRPALVSTGTWAVAFAPGKAARLDPARDMLFNIDADGCAVASARFMCGREWDAIAGDGTPTIDAARRLIEQGAIALPSFAAAGPFQGRAGRIEGRVSGAEEQASLASLYAALVTDVLLDLLAVEGDVVVEGPVASDPVFLSMLGACRTGGSIARGTASLVPTGAARLAFGQGRAPLVPADAPSADLRMMMRHHRKLWRQRIEETT